MAVTTLSRYQWLDLLRDNPDVVFNAGRAAWEMARANSYQQRWDILKPVGDQVAPLIDQLASKPAISAAPGAPAGLSEHEMEQQILHALNGGNYKERMKFRPQVGSIDQRGAAEAQVGKRSQRGAAEAQQGNLLEKPGDVPGNGGDKVDMQGRGEEQGNTPGTPSGGTTPSASGTPGKTTAASTAQQAAAATPSGPTPAGPTPATVTPATVTPAGGPAPVNPVLVKENPQAAATPAVSGVSITHQQSAEAAKETTPPTQQGASSPTTGDSSASSSGGAPKPNPGTPVATQADVRGGQWPPPVIPEGANAGQVPQSQAAGSPTTGGTVTVGSNSPLTPGQKEELAKQVTHQQSQPISVQEQMTGERFYSQPPVTAPGTFPSAHPVSMGGDMDAQAFKFDGTFLRTAIQLLNLLLPLLGNK